MYKSLLAYVTYAPTMLTRIIASDSPTKAISIFDSCSSKAASKYLKGEKYFKKSRFLFKVEMTERKYVPSKRDTATELAILYRFKAQPRKMPMARKINCMMKSASIHKARKL